VIKMSYLPPLFYEWINRFSKRQFVYDSKKIYYFLLIMVLAIIILQVNLMFSSGALIFDSDSGFEFTNAQRILLFNSIEPGPFLQQFLYAELFSLFRIIDYKLILFTQSLLSTMVILSTIQFLKSKGDNLLLVLLLTPLFFTLNQVFFWGNYTLKPYPLYLFLLTLSIYYFDKGLRCRRNSVLFLSALFLGSSIMTHTLCLPFIFLPALYYFFKKIKLYINGKQYIKVEEERQLFKKITYFYFFLFVILIPYIVWRVSVSGLSLNTFLYYPFRWGTIKYGYITNIIFWKFPMPYSLQYYNSFANLVINILFCYNLSGKNLAFIIPFLLLIVLATFGFLKFKNKCLLLSWLSCLALPYVIGRGVLSFVYMYIFVPFVVILSVWGLLTFSKTSKSIKIKKPRNITFMILLLIIVFSSFACFSESLQTFNIRMNRISSPASEIIWFSWSIPIGSNVLFRSRAISPLMPYRNVLMISDLSEEAAITYLNWTSDVAVANVFRQYNINYVVLYKDIKFEKDYYVWFKLITGETPKHYLMIEKSLYFKKVYEGNYYVLYKFLG